MMDSDLPSVQWIDRPAFTKMAAMMLHKGGDWSMIMIALPKYAKPRPAVYRKDHPIPELRGKPVPLRLNAKQSAELQKEVERRRKDLQIQERGGRA